MTIVTVTGINAIKLLIAVVVAVVVVPLVVPEIKYYYHKWSSSSEIPPNRTVSPVTPIEQRAIPVLPITPPASPLQGIKSMGSKEDSSAYRSRSNSGSSDPLLNQDLFGAHSSSPHAAASVSHECYYCPLCFKEIEEEEKKVELGFFCPTCREIYKDNKSEIEASSEEYYHPITQKMKASLTSSLSAESLLPPGARPIAGETWKGIDLWFTSDMVGTYKRELASTISERTQKNIMAIIERKIGAEPDVSKHPKILQSYMLGMIYVAITELKCSRQLEAVSSWTPEIKADFAAALTHRAMYNRIRFEMGKVGAIDRDLSDIWRTKTIALGDEMNFNKIVYESQLGWPAFVDLMDAQRYHGLIGRGHRIVQIEHDPKGKKPAFWVVATIE